MSHFLKRLFSALLGVFIASWVALFVFSVGLNAGLFNAALQDTMAKYAPSYETLSIGGLIWGSLTGETALALERAVDTFLGLLCGPIALIALVGEIMAWWRWGFYVVGTAIAIPVFAFAFVAIMWTSDLSVFPMIILGLISIGIIAGAVYWLIAGRSAGRTVTL